MSDSRRICLREKENKMNKPKPKMYRFEIYYSFNNSQDKWESVKGAIVEATDLITAISKVPEYAEHGFLGKCNWICPEYWHDYLCHVEAGDSREWTTREDLGEGRFVKCIDSVRTWKEFKSRYERLMREYETEKCA